MIHKWQNDSRTAEGRLRRMKSARYLQRGRETWRSAAVVLPPGVTAKRRLRTFKVDVLVHTRRIVVRHPVTTRSESDHQQYFCCGAVIAIFKNHRFVFYSHRRGARRCHVGFGSRVGHLGIFDVGIFPLFHLIPLQSDNVT